MKNGLYKLRKAKNLTLKEVGEKLGCSSVAVFQYETFKRTPSINILKKYAEILGVSVKRLVDAYDETI